MTKRVYKRKYPEGTRFHHLTIVGYNPAKGRYVCKCDCGNQTEASVFALSHGKHKSCGCLQFRPERAKSLNPGDKFGHLTVLSFSEEDGAWLCSCVCGGTTLAEASRLKDGSRTGCGCRVSTAQRPQKWLPDDLSFKRKLYGIYRKQAANRSFTFDLSFDDFVSYLNLPCAYCGTSNTNVMTAKSRTKRSVRTFVYNGIDRIDNGSGYSTANCVACCKHCNYAKRDLSHGNFIALVKRIASRFTIDTRANSLLTADRRIYIIATGAGAGLTGLIWDVPGISKVLVGTAFPYASEATDRFLGFKPDHYCSEKTAVALALEAYYLAFQPGGAPPVGLGLTASVASNTAHRGDHRVFVATVTDQGCLLYSATLVKGVGKEARKRDGELADALGLAALLEATGQPDTTNILPSLLSFERAECSSLALMSLLERPLFKASGKRLPMPTNGNGLTLFPGAFNPPHEAHTWLGKEYGATFHVTVNPPHKPELSVAEILQRAKMLEGFDRLFTTNDPLYIDKARCFPGAKFVVGSDAMIRMLDPKWGPDPMSMMDEFRHLGVKFLVADREQDGKIVSLEDIPMALWDICTRIMRPAQHLGLSSTKIRKAMTAGK